MYGVLNIIAEIGAEPVTVRKSTPNSPTACLRSLGTSWRCDTSRLSASPAVTTPPSPAVPACSLVSDMRPASCQDRVVSLALVRGHAGYRGRRIAGRWSGRDMRWPGRLRRAGESTGASLAAAPAKADTTATRPPWHANAVTCGLWGDAMASHREWLAAPKPCRAARRPRP